METSAKIKPGDIVTLEYARLGPRAWAPRFIVLSREAELPSDIAVYCFYSGEAQYDWEGKSWEIGKERLRIFNH